MISLDLCNRGFGLEQLADSQLTAWHRHFVGEHEEITSYDLRIGIENYGKRNALKKNNINKESRRTPCLPQNHCFLLIADALATLKLCFSGWGGACVDDRHLAGFRDLSCSCRCESVSCLYGDS